MLATIRATVSEKTIEKVTRLFNQALTDIVPELFQNARRAGATTIAVSIQGTGAILIRDDGSGISDPQTILTLGASGWNQETLDREDPAGMGFFALAGREVTVSSRSADRTCGWQATIEAQDWTGDNAIAVSKVVMACGTGIRIPLRDQEARQVAEIVKRAARYLPLTVTLDGSEIERLEFLAGAIHVKPWKGCRIGVMKGNDHRDRMNFHGLQIAGRDLPTVSMVQGATYFAYVNMGSANEIQFVLPARREVVRNEAYGELTTACKIAIYEAVANLDGHSLGHADWLEAELLGITLPEARPVLYPWVPRKADCNSSDFYKPVRQIPADAVLMSQQSPLADHCIDRALQGEELRERLYEQDSHFAGYSWYERLPRIRHAAFRVVSETLAVEFDDQGDLDTQAPLDCESQKTDQISLILTLTRGTMDSTLEFPADFVATECERWNSDVDNLRIFWTTDAVQDFDGLHGLIEEGAFSPSDDSDSDSYYTQRQNFQDELRPLLAKLMLGERHSAEVELKRLLDRHLYLLPKGTSAMITVNSKGSEIVLIDEHTSPAA